ncbi:hypothetical protein QFZ53_001487 [Microbacterium natoriense]|uniref:Uncharacterized protein n=1 Tax=Microbacterium natoriense TaxID=284570 RepID=A0AAW8EUW1_9MICO|nr:hypothetical protein [Microbacterium natoriense]
MRSPSILAYEIRDLTQDPSALEQVKALGYLQSPVVIAGVASVPTRSTSSPPASAEHDHEYDNHHGAGTDR